MKKLAPALFAAVLALSGSIAAHAQTSTTMVIDHLPYTINARGLYVLTNSLSSTQTDGNLIDIEASNVTIDLQGNYISGPVGNTTQNTYGIYAFKRNNITVKNGTIANVQVGVLLASTGYSTTVNVSHELDHLRVAACNNVGIVLSFTTSSSVTNCKVSNIGSSDINGRGTAAAIATQGFGNVVQNCAISQVFNNNNTGSGSGISLGDGDFARQNTIYNSEFGVRGGTYQDNLTRGCATPFTGGTDAGGNK